MTSTTLPRLRAKLQSFRAFAQDVWALSMPYFKSQDKWKARGLLAAIVALNLASVYMLVLLNDWNRLFYDALQNKDQAVFWRELGRFGYLAFGFILIAVYRFLPDAIAGSSLALVDDRALPDALVVAPCLLHHGTGALHRAQKR
jgi:ABC-type uncharacterized transport system fused permease/ATPase subunit